MHTKATCILNKQQPRINIQSSIAKRFTNTDICHLIFHYVHVIGKRIIKNGLHCSCHALPMLTPVVDVTIFSLDQRALCTSFSMNGCVGSK